MLIVFIGVDGSGKSTLAKAVADGLRDVGKEVTVIRPVKYCLLGGVVGLVRALSGSKKPKNFKENPFLEKRKRSAVCKLWPILATLDFYLIYLFKILPLVLKFDVVICDRYLYDKLLGFEYYGYSYPKMTRTLFPLVPRPREIFCLTCDPKVAQAREEGVAHEPGFYSYLNQRYRDLGKAHSLRMIETIKISKGTERLILNLFRKKR